MNLFKIRCTVFFLRLFRIWLVIRHTTELFLVDLNLAWLSFCRMMMDGVLPWEE